MEQELNENRALDVDSSFDYVRSKALAEKMITEANGKELETIVLSPTAVIGPHDYKPSLLGDAVIRFHKGKAPALIPGGYDWVDVRDICIAAMNAIEMGQPGEKYILSGHWRSLKELTDIIHKLGGAKPPLLTVPFALAMASAPLLNLYSKMRKQSPLYTNVTLDAVARSHRIISSQKAKTTLKYSPRPFEETVADTIRWFKEEHYI
jgi:dihydroflavonol-4-reductase